MQATSSKSIQLSFSLSFLGFEKEIQLLVCNNAAPETFFSHKIEDWKDLEEIISVVLGCQYWGFGDFPEKP